MSRSDTVEKIQNIMIDVFDIDDLEISEDTTAQDIDEWDSLSHIRFMITVEKFLKIKFRNEEIAELKNVGDLARAIESKLG